jgi:hypothetical protein
MEDGATGVANLSLREAAMRCGVTKTALRRHLDRHEFPGAWRADGHDGAEGIGEWRIPIDDLVAAGFTPRRH